MSEENTLYTALDKLGFDWDSGRILIKDKDNVDIGLPFGWLPGEGSDCILYPRRIIGKLDSCPYLNKPLSDIPKVICNDDSSVYVLNVSDGGSEFIKVLKNVSRYRGCELPIINTKSI